MRKWIFKYRSFVGTLILAGYLFLNVSNIFHHHKFILGAESAIDVEQLQNLINASFSGTGCTVQQNFQSVNTLIFPIPSIVIELKQETADKLLLNSNNLLSNNFHSANHLRAPPEIS